MAPDPPKVFISYSHDTAEHEERVLALTERLRKEGMDAQLDQYVAGTPAEGWPRWMLDRLDWADFVLVACTETYYRRFRGHEEDKAKGKGADWEGDLITLEMYGDKSKKTKFAAVFFTSQDEQFVPEPLRGHTQYLLNSEENYTKLYAFFTGQAGVRPGELGSLKTLARKQVQPLSFGAANMLTRRTTHNLPFARNPAFTGRDEELNELDRMLRSPRKEAAIQVVIVHGLGGVGKIQLAVEYAWKRLDDYDAVLWVKADNQEALNRGLAALASVLRLPEAGEREQAMQIEAVLKWLYEHERWLLIAGDAETDEAVSALFDRLPLSLPGKVLVTSRISNWPVEYQELEILPLSLDAATDYLLKRVPKGKYNAGDESAARLLADKLGDLPLALANLDIS